MVRIGFISVTIAVKARRLLRKVNVASRMTRLDDVIPTSGCTYALEIEDSQMLAAAAALRRGGIEYRVVGDG